MAMETSTSNDQIFACACSALVLIARPIGIWSAFEGYLRKRDDWKSQLSVGCSTSIEKKWVIWVRSFFCVTSYKCSRRDTSQIICQGPSILIYRHVCIHTQTHIYVYMYNTQRGRMTWFIYIYMCLSVHLFIHFLLVYLYIDVYLFMNMFIY